MKYLLTIAYDGTAYCGWQIQPDNDTVQGRITEAAKKIFGMPCSISGCSRTDSGVHALDFKATLEPTADNAPIIPCNRLPIALNTCLPPDISVLSAETVDDTFHVRYDVKRKEYLYRIKVSNVKDPFEKNRSYLVYKPLSIELMNKAAEYIIGKQDFACFMASGSNIKDTVRTVYSAHFEEKNGIIEFRIQGDGFLYNMVRIIVGTMLSVSNGSITPQEIPEIIASKDRTRAGMTVPASGLYLARVYY